MTERLRRAIAWWQIVCGVLGFTGLTIFAADWPTGSRRILTDLYGPYNVVLSIAYFGTAIIAGVRLKRGERAGVRGSILCQALQVVSFGFVGGLEVAIDAGPHFKVFLTSYEVKTSIGFNSQFFIGTRAFGVPWEVGVNFLALVWTVVLVRSLRRDSSDGAVTELRTLQGTEQPASG